VFGLLQKNNGPLELSTVWAAQILKYSLNFTKRKATTTRRLTVEERKAAVSKMNDLELEYLLYHPALILEMDETKVPWCPAESYTYAPTAAEKISIHGQNDKRASTATITEIPTTIIQIRKRQQINGKTGRQ